MSAPSPLFLFYGGKGGVGKTTCAAARAVAEAARGARVLVVSTDPAHSLGDALATRLSSRPSVVRVGGRRTMMALELDARRAFDRWLSEHRPALGDILENGTWLDRADVEALLDLSLPGVDELVGMLEIARLARATGSMAGARGSSRAASGRLTAPASGRAHGSRASAKHADASGRRAPYDLVIVDTAPTGHALRLIASPRTVAAVADILDALQESHRIIRQQLARIGRPEAADRLITLLAEQARDMAATLRDPEQTAFHWVTLPEALSLAESEDGIAALGQSGIPVAEVIVNRAIPDGGPCPICDLRRAGERKVVATIRRGLARRSRLRVIAADVNEPRGIEALARIGRQLARVMAHGSWLMAEKTIVRAKPSAVSHQPLTPREALSHQPSAMSHDRDHARSPVVSLPAGARTVSPETLDIFRDAKLLFVGGKGGVGKTTVAAAAAIRLARAQPGQRTLLLSTDPAHSLADVFDARRGAIGDTATPVRGAPPNLAVRELDASTALAARRIDLEKALEEISSAFGAETLHDDLADAAGPGDSRRSLRSTSVSDSAARLIDLAPPGIDELFGVISVVEARHEYDRIVVDTAPTGHAIRLLEMPDAAREWVQAILRMLLKYRTLVHPGRLAQELVDASKSIRELHAILRDPSHTRFIVVTRAADVPRLETERLMDRLRRLKLSAPALVVNALTLAPGRCRRCRATASLERRSQATLRRRCAARARRCAIIQTPLAAPAPRGVKALERWGARWIIDMAHG